MAVAFLSVTACGGGSVSDGTGPGPTPPTDTTKPPTVQRASITAHVTIDSADAAIASTAGISLSGLTVRLTSSRASDPVRTAITAADGTARFDDLLEGIYTASVERRLTADEIARLSPADREASVFAAGGQVVLSPPNARSVDVALVGARRGSLVISEIFAYNGPTESRGYDLYVYGSYMEVYNNSDTTAYLDGVLYMMTNSNWYYNSETSSCATQPKSLRLDSTALYTLTIVAFPGSGRDYPILPGEAKVVAMDAINHATASPEFNQLDLSRADFEEFWTDADVDNPYAANIVRVYGSTAGVFGRGRGFFIIGAQMVLLSPQARPYISEVTIPDINGKMYTIAQIPSRYLLDILSLTRPPTVDDDFPPCVPWTSASYDRAPSELRDFDVRKAVRRRSLGLSASGHEILQRTHNSARDFELFEPLRRSLDK